MQFIAADMPNANNLIVGIMVLVAQQEWEAISKRTKEALQAAKKRGKVLGNPQSAEALRRAVKGNVAAVSVIRSKADIHTMDLKLVIEALGQEGITSLGAIAAALNDRGMQTPRGGQWHKTSVSNPLARMKATKA